MKKLDPLKKMEKTNYNHSSEEWLIEKYLTDLGNQD